MDFQNHTTVFFRDPGVYGLVPPAILPATVVRTYTNWTGERVIVQPEGLAPRDIPVADVIEPVNVDGAFAFFAYIAERETIFRAGLAQIRARGIADDVLEIERGGDEQEELGEEYHRFCEIADMRYDEGRLS